jgi:hypothetical protein
MLARALSGLYTSVIKHLPASGPPSSQPGPF